MRRIITVVFLGLFSLSIQAQDKVELERIVNQLYTAISFGDAKDFDEETLFSLLTEDCQMISTGGKNMQPISKEVYAERMKEFKEKGMLKSFTERGLKNKFQIFGNVAQGFCSYETEMLLGKGEKRKARGVNCYQFIKTSNGWRVSQIIWFDENDEVKLPRRMK